MPAAERHVIRGYAGAIECRMEKIVKVYLNNYGLCVQYWACHFL